MNYKKRGKQKCFFKLNAGARSNKYFILLIPFLFLYIIVELYQICNNKLKKSHDPLKKKESLLNLDLLS